MNALVGALKDAQVIPDELAEKLLDAIPLLSRAIAGKSEFNEAASDWLVLPVGWFALDVMKAGNGRKRDWCALMIDVHPDELKHCACRTAFIYVHPNEYRPDGSRTAREAWVRIPGKYRNKEAAWDALLQDMLVTRH